MLQSDQDAAKKHSSIFRNDPHILYRFSTMQKEAIPNKKGDLA